MESNHRLCFINMLPLYQLPTDLLNRHSWMVLTHSWLRKTIDKMFNANFTIIIITTCLSCWKYKLKVSHLPSGHRDFSIWKLLKSHLFWYNWKTCRLLYGHHGMFFCNLYVSYTVKHILKPKWDIWATIPSPYD